MAGLWYEEFKDGMVFNHEWSRTITETDNVWFSLADHERAAAAHRRALRGEIRMGQAAGEQPVHAGADDRHVGQRHDFQHDARQSRHEGSQLSQAAVPGDSVKTRTTVLSKRESSRARTRASSPSSMKMTNQNGEVVATCERAALMRKRPAGTA